MKKKNCNCEFKNERSRLLLENFRKSLAEQSTISAERAFRDAVSSPAPRFWVSEARATAVIRLMLKGKDPTVSMIAEKARMYREIYRRVVRLLEKEPAQPLGDLVFRVVNSEAPSYYMCVKHARRLVGEAKKLQKATKIWKLK